MILGILIYSISKIIKYLIYGMFLGVIYRIMVGVNKKIKTRLKRITINIAIITINTIVYYRYYTLNFSGKFEIYSIIFYALGLIFYCSLTESLLKKNIELNIVKIKLKNIFKNKHQNKANSKN